MSDINTMINESYELFEKKEFSKSIQKNLEIELMLEKEDKETFGEAEKREMLSSLANFSGFNYLGLTDLENAKKSFEAALNYNPNSSQACAGIAEVFYLMEKDDESKIMYEWAVDGNPTNQFAVAGLAKINRKLGLSEQHNSLNIDTTLRKKEEFYTILTNAYKKYSEKKYNESLNDLLIAERSFSRNLHSRDNISKISSLENFKGFNYLALHELSKARESFEKSLELNPASSQACCGLAELFFVNGQDNEAKQMFEWGMKNNPSNPIAIEGLRKINRILGHPELHNSLFL